MAAKEARYARAQPGRHSAPFRLRRTAPQQPPRNARSTKAFRHYIIQVSTRYDVTRHDSGETEE